MTKYILVLIFCLPLGTLVAQEMEVNKNVQSAPVLNISSSFKPSLIDISKNVYSPIQLSNDTTPKSFNYSKENINPSISFSNNISVPISPLYLNEKKIYPTYENSFNLGMGNVYRNIPSVIIGLQNGDGDNVHMSMLLSHQSMTGHLKNQNAYSTQLDFNVKHKNPNAIWDYKVFGIYKVVNKYGINPYTDTTKLLQEKYNSFKSIGLQGQYTNQHQWLNVDSKLGLTTSLLNTQNQEYSIAHSTDLYYFIISPKIWTHSLINKLNILSNIDFLNHNKSLDTISWFLNTNLTFNYSSSYIQADLGISTFYNKNLNDFFVPYFNFQTPILSNLLYINFGTKGEIINNNYYSYFNTNNFLVDTVVAYKSTLTKNYFLKFHGSWKNTFKYELSAVYQSIKNLPLYKNDTNDTKSFTVLYLDKINNFKIGGSLLYNFRDMVFAKVAGYKNYYTNYDIDFLWGLPEYEIEAYIKLSLMKNKLHISLDYKGLSDNWYIQPTVIYNRYFNNIACGTEYFNDISMTVSYRFNRFVEGWLKGNNLLNRRNDRWGNYAEMPINFSVGAVFYLFYKTVMEPKKQYY